MKRIIFSLLSKSGIILFLLFSSVSSFAQYIYISDDNNSFSPGLWNDPNTWSVPNDTNPYWSPGATPGQPNTHSNFNGAEIYGYTLVNGDLTVTQANPVINIYDTLFIDGNFTFGTGARMYIHPNGLLVVKGNLRMQGSAGIENAGNIVVTENLNVTNGYIVNQSEMYVYGTTTKSGGGRVNGCDNWNNCNNVGSTNSLKNENALFTENEPLYNFVSSGNVVLPVKLQFFKAVATSNTVILSWATSEEENFDYFTVERSKDGQVFETIGELFSEGSNTKSRRDYSTSDNRPYAGTSYYRLKATDFDGTVEYFKAIYIVFEPQKISAGIYPNPGSGQYLQIQLTDNEKPENTTFRLYSLSGALIYQQEMNFPANNTITFDSPLEKGIYLAVIQSDTDSKTLKWLVE